MYCTFSFDQKEYQLPLRSFSLHEIRCMRTFSLHEMRTFSLHEISMLLPAPTAFPLHKLRSCASKWTNVQLCVACLVQVGRDTYRTHTNHASSLITCANSTFAWASFVHEMYCTCWLLAGNCALCVFILLILPTLNHNSIWCNSTYLRSIIDQCRQN